MSTSRPRRTDLPAIPPAGLKLSLPTSPYGLAALYAGRFAAGARITSEEQRRRVQHAMDRTLDDLTEIGVEAGAIAVME